MSAEMNALRVLVPLIAGAGAAACGGGLAPGAYVVVSHASTFHASAATDGIRFRAQTDPPLADAAEDAAGGVVLRVRSVENGWAEVENPAPAELGGHCRGALEEIAPFRLRFYVPAEALDRVVARPVHERYPDGTSIDLLPGLPLGTPDGAGREPAWRSNVTLHLALPADAVARGYAAPAPETIRAFAVPPGELPEDAPVLIGGARLTVGPHVVETHQAMSVRAHPIAEGVLVELADACSKLTALAKPEDIGPFGYGGPPGSMAYGASGHVTDHDTRYLYPGTALFWADGTPAGEARAERSYDLWHRGTTRKDLACIVHDSRAPRTPSVPTSRPSARRRTRRSRPSSRSASATPTRISASEHARRTPSCRCVTAGL